jgi:hypothetical protein
MSWEYLSNDNNIASGLNRGKKKNEIEKATTQRTNKQTNKLSNLTKPKPN